MSTSIRFFQQLSLYFTTFFAATIVVAQGQQATIYKPLGYNIHTIPTPQNIPFHITGMDVNKNSEIVVATRLGEIWILSDKKNNGEQKWHRFANGLTEPTGLLCEDDGSIIVGHKPELTKLVDSNNDGIADEYINLADNWEFHDNYHEFNFAPVKDNIGNYYGTLNLGHGNKDAFSLGTMDSAGGYRGWAYKVSSSGQFTPYAYGLRSPAGIGSSPNGEIFFTDNQGDWVPTSKLHLLKENTFYGHPVSLRDVPGYTPEKIRKMSTHELAKLSEKPVLWIPHIEVANSPGNPEWDTTKGKFGPFTGQIFISDQTQSNIFRALIEKVNGQYQGAVINFMNGFQSGNIRIKFDNSGQLWVGQTARGWGAKGNKPFGLQKVTWDGKTTPFELLTITMTQKGFRITFTEPLDAKTIQKSNFKAEQWHYLYSGNYGSEKMDLSAVNIKSTALSNDKKSIDINMTLSKDKVLALDFSQIKSVSGQKPSVGKVFYTINALK